MMVTISRKLRIYKVLEGIKTLVALKISLYFCIRLCTSCIIIVCTHVHMRRSMSLVVLCLPVKISTSFDATKILIVETMVDTKHKLLFLTTDTR